MENQEIINHLEEEIKACRKYEAIYRKHGLTTLWELENARLTAYTEILNWINEVNKGS